MAAEGGPEHAARWASHPVLARLVRFLVVAIPIAAGFLAASALARVWRTPRSVPGLVAWWGSLGVASTVVVLLVERLARRLLPLAVLLELTLLFPGAAPSRWRVSRGSRSARALEREVADLDGDEAADPAAVAARHLLALVSRLGSHDRRSRGHSERVRTFTELLGVQLKLSEVEQDKLRWVSLVHDVGKLNVPPHVLNKDTAPTEGEWTQLRRHPAEGARIAADLLPWLGEWGRGIAEHHERFDGTGYPAGLAGDEISLSGRILAVTDSFEVMTAGRAYQKAMSAAAARAELTRCAGTQFDPAVVRAFLAIGIKRLRWVVGIPATLLQLPLSGGIASAVPAQVGRVAVTGMTVSGLVVSGTVAPVLARPAPAQEQVTPPRPAPPESGVRTSDRRPASTVAPGTRPRPSADSKPGVGADKHQPPESSKSAKPRPDPSASRGAPGTGPHPAATRSPGPGNGGNGGNADKDRRSPQPQATPSASKSTDKSGY